MDKVLYLSEYDVEAVELGVAEIHAAVETALVAKCNDRAMTAPKVAIAPRPGDTIQALVGTSLQAGVNGCKWVNVTQRNADVGLPPIHATLLLNNLHDGRPRAVINADWLTAVRTAACTAVAANYLAPEDSETVGFIGCGLQARTHLDALAYVRPTLRRILCCSRTQASVQRFADHCRARGFEAIVCKEPRAAIEEADIVVTTVPSTTKLQPFLDATWLKQTAFVGAVDLGRSWHQESWRNAFDCVVTDDRKQSMERGKSGLMLTPDRFDAEIGELSANSWKPLNAQHGRSAVLFSGIVIADIAVGLALEAKARRLGIGTYL